jgi:hypothetical protein
VLRGLCHHCFHHLANFAVLDTDKPAQLLCTENISATLWSSGVSAGDRIGTTVLCAVVGLPSRRTAMTDEGFAVSSARGSLARVRVWAGGAGREGAERAVVSPAPLHLAMDYMYYLSYLMSHRFPSCTDNPDIFYSCASEREDSIIGMSQQYPSQIHKQPNKQCSKQHATTRLRP